MDTILGILAEGSIRVIAIAIFIAFVLWGMGVKSPTVRHRAWIGVLMSMLLLPFISLWIPRVSIPLLPAYPDIQEQHADNFPREADRLSSLDERIPNPTMADSKIGASEEEASQAKEANNPTSQLGMPQLVGIFYLVGFLVFSARLLVGMILIHRLSRHAIRDGRGFYFAHCNVPLTLGLLKPRILLPLSAKHWDSRKLASVLIHEQEHACRHDPLVEWLALLNRCLYWFHPLAWWLRRKLAVLAEQACDEAVIASGRDPNSYAELLLELARSVKQRGVLATNWGSSIEGGALMERIQKILMIRNWTRISRFQLAFVSLLCITAILIPALCTLVPAQEYSSQRAVYLVSQAISAEDNSDLDEALQLYREVLSTPSDQKVYAAYAQFRIAQIRLLKGNLTEAAREFENLANNYPEYSDMIGQFIAQDYTGIFHGYPSVQNLIGPTSTIRNNKYRHNLTGLEFSLEDWTVAMEAVSTGGGEMIILQGPNSEDYQISAWVKPDRIAAEDITSRLRGAAQEKILQRLSYRNYRMRPDSLQPSTINGKQALSAISDYLEPDNTRMIEYLTWIYTEKTRSLFFSRLRASEFEAFKPIFDQFVATAAVQ